jgi:hypothetical protein
MLAAIVLATAIANLPPPVRGDFDHDGKTDVAEVVAGKDGVYRLVVRRSDRRRSVALIQEFDGRELTNLYLDTARPGRWRTWCGKGGGSDSDPCPHKTVMLRGDTLSFGMKEASESIAIWNGRRFEVVLLSD